LTRSISWDAYDVSLRKSGVQAEAAAARISCRCRPGRADRGGKRCARETVHRPGRLAVAQPVEEVDAVLGDEDVAHSQTGAGEQLGQGAHDDAAPIGGEGVLIELVQAPPEVISAFARIAAASGNADDAARLYREVVAWSKAARPHQARESLFVALAGNPATAAERGLAEIAEPRAGTALT